MDLWNTADMSFPEITEDTKDHHKEAHIDMDLPMNIDPEHVHVTCKGHDIIVRADEKRDTPNSHSEIHIYRRTTMPKGTDMRHLKCMLNDRATKLSIDAPMRMS